MFNPGDRVKIIVWQMGVFPVENIRLHSEPSINIDFQRDLLEPGCQGTVIAAITNHITSDTYDGEATLDWVLLLVDNGAFGWTHELKGLQSC